MIGAGIDSFKIEGRMKTALYVAAVARTYRKAIDDYLESEEKYRANMEWYKEEISKCTYRQFTTGFYFGKPDENTQIYDSNTYINEYIYLGSIDRIEIMKPDGDNIEASVLSLRTEDGQQVESAPHPQQVLYVELSTVPAVFDLLRVRKMDPENAE